MQLNKPIPRKEFIKAILYFSTIPFLLLANSLVKNHRLQSIQNKAVELPDDIPVGISFLNEIIITKDNLSIKAFSSKCPHLGCIINKSEGEEIICPCHGSRFNFHGNVIKGPAFSSLIQLPILTKNEKKTVILPQN